MWRTKNNGDVGDRMWKKYNSNENNRQPSKEDNTKKDPFHYSVSEV